MATTTRNARTRTKPLDELRRLLPKITHDELLKLTALAHDELGRRCHEYAEALCEIEQPPRDAINEAIAFAHRADDLVPVNYSSRSTKADAWWRIHSARQDLEVLYDAS